MTEITTYRHKVQYYETDAMGIAHHSNYIRWFEEARTDYLEQIGYSYKRLEEEGIISPVLEIEAKYKSSVHYGDFVDIEVKLTSFNGVKFYFSYTIKDVKTGEVCTTGTSGHCLLDRQNRPVRLKKINPKLYELLESLVES